MLVGMWLRRGLARRFPVVGQPLRDLRRPLSDLQHKYVYRASSVDPDRLEVITPEEFAREMEMTSRESAMAGGLFSQYGHAMVFVQESHRATAYFRRKGDGGGGGGGAVACASGTPTSDEHLEAQGLVIKYLPNLRFVQIQRCGKHRRVFSYPTATAKIEVPQRNARGHQCRNQA